MSPKLWKLLITIGFLTLIVISANLILYFFSMAYSNVHFCSHVVMNYHLWVMSSSNLRDDGHFRQLSTSCGSAVFESLDLGRVALANGTLIGLWFIKSFLIEVIFLWLNPPHSRQSTYNASQKHNCKQGRTRPIRPDNQVGRPDPSTSQTWDGKMACGNSGEKTLYTCQ